MRRLAPEEEEFWRQRRNSAGRRTDDDGESKRAYAKDNMMLFKNVEDTLIPPEEVERLAKSYDEGHAEVRMHTMRRSTERLVIEKTADEKEFGVAVDDVRFELLALNCYSIHNGSWEDLTPTNDRARMGFNVEGADSSRRTAVERARRSTDSGEEHRCL